MDDVQPSLTDAEYALRRRKTRREEFLTLMDRAIPWQQWTDEIQPYYHPGRRGRKPVRLETMLRMYLLQVWFSLSDQGVEDQVNDSYAMRQFMGVDFAREQVPDATTLWRFRQLLRHNGLGKHLLDVQRRFLADRGWAMRGGAVVDARIVVARPTKPANPAQPSIV